MEPSDLLRLAAKKLEDLGVSYFVTGSMASILYGEPRFTNDVDIVIHLEAQNAPCICAAFPEPDFYVSDEAAHQATVSFTQFNVIHPASGMKIDFMVADHSTFNRERFARTRSIEILPNVCVRFASPEDVIIRKLEYYKEGGSDKHVRDIRGILKLSGESMDIDYIQTWADRKGVLDEWRMVNGP